MTQNANKARARMIEARDTHAKVLAAPFDRDRAERARDKILRDSGGYRRLAPVRGQMLAIEDASIQAQCASSFRSLGAARRHDNAIDTSYGAHNPQMDDPDGYRAPTARATGLQQISGIRSLGAVRAGPLPDVMSEPEPRQGMLAVEGGASWWLQRPENRLLVMC